MRTEEVKARVDYLIQTNQKMKYSHARIKRLWANPEEYTEEDQLYRFLVKNHRYDLIEMED
ncbi:hypothetical protein [Lacticaseibacillus paracasei]|uniref:hypothetical protein n=1 Tax=Lacticaseibacillus paracasei TaxID=1597 RepID=UPI002FFBA83C